MVPVIRTAYFGGPWACLTSWTGPRLQHSLHALPNKLLVKSTLCILSMKGYFSMVCSIDRTSCSAVVCDKHVPLWPLWCSVPPADETSADFLIPDALFFFSLRTRLVKRGLFSSAKEFWNGGRLLTPFPSCREVRLCVVTQQTRCAVTSLEAGGVVQ